MAGRAGQDPETWCPRGVFVARIASSSQLRTFNDTGGIAVRFDVMRSRAPRIGIVGSQSRALSLWVTRSASSFVTAPKFNAGLVTVRFVTSGHVDYRHDDGRVQGSPAQATLVGFDRLREVVASDAFCATGVSLTAEALAAANAALTGGDQHGLPALAPSAAVAGPGITALLCTIRRVHRRIQEAGREGDFMLPLIEEVLSYQLLSTWPRRADPPAAGTGDMSDRSFQAALDYIEANLSRPLALADVAAAAGIGVRSLQDRFRRQIARTPVQFIIDRRLARAHQDLGSAREAALSVAEIAGRWGFVHMSDFAQRYRRLYGRTPSETRRDAVRRS